MDYEYQPMSYIQQQPPTEPPNKKKKGNGLKFVCIFLSVVLVFSLVSSIIILNSYKKVVDRNSEIEQLLEQYGTDIEALKGSSNGSSSGGTNSKLSYVANTGGNLSLVEIANKVKPSIVGIRVIIPSQQMNYGFGRYQTQEQQVEGSGIIISEDGYIITNEHVITNVKTNEKAYIEVILENGKEYTAEYIGSDATNDIAVIKITPEETLTVAELGSSDSLNVGEIAVAIGNPLGQEFAGSVTQGIISALGRVLSMENSAESMIQTDAAINPGNSGGALVNGNGEIIGITTSKISDTNVEGLGFAIPIDYAMPIIQSIIDNGYVKGRITIGISGEEITSMMARYYNLPSGIMVTEVVENSGADLAGLQEYDIITSFNGQSVSSMQELDDIKAKCSIGDTVEVKYYRNGQTYTANLMLMEDKSDG